VEHARPDDEWLATVRRAAERQRVELDLPAVDFPVYGLVGATEPGWLAAGLTTGEDKDVYCVRVGYGTPDDQRYVEVETWRRGTANCLYPLDWLLATRFAWFDEPYPVPGRLPEVSCDGLPAAPRAHPVELTVDGRPMPALAQRVAPYAAWRLATDDLVVTVLGGLDTPPTLAALADPAAYQHRAPWPPPVVLRAEPEPLTGPDDTAPLWAHRALLAMTTASHEHFAAMRAENRPPLSLDPLWAQRWAAAYRRQRELRDQGADAAREAVAAMVHQVGDLQQHAGWWSDAGLARRAVDEIIWVTATGEDTVSSAEAQRAFAYDRLPGRDAWQEWADRVGS
jgi:hypothetical protein